MGFDGRCYGFQVKTRAIVATLVCLVAVAALIAGPARPASAQNAIEVMGVVYDLPDNNRFDYSSSEEQTIAVLGQNARSQLIIEGDVNEGKIENGIPGYAVVSGNVSLSCMLEPNRADTSSAGWEPSDDTATTVSGVDVGGKINSGAIVLQSSIDRIFWTNELIETDVFSGGAQTKQLYTTKDIQLQNGCYYRLIVAYELCRHVDDSQILMVTTHNYEFRNVAEVFEFYAVTIDESQRTSSSTTPRKSLGTKANTGLDNGFSESNAIDKDDMHFGWDLGEFFVNGYTRETVDRDGNPVFLKNVGDRVTLWFRLNQDIEMINGDPNLTVSVDKNGYDRDFEVPQANLGRGVLIVRFTDHEGVAHDPVIYTDFLAANAKTGADTRVQLFEEGDYEVALDYEIVHTQQIGPISQPQYGNYQVRFKFSIRNGNCMVYPMDAGTGAELAANALTENGFRLDMARSRYLTIDVVRSTVSMSGGALVEDVRFNRPAKDGDQYLDSGIYTFTVSNLYTGESTTKTIYVGTDKYLRALARNGMTVADLNAKLAAGTQVTEEGELVSRESVQ